MYFSMLVIATMSDWEKKMEWKTKGIHANNEKIYLCLIHWRNCIRLSKMQCAILPKLTKFLVCCWFGQSTYNEPRGLVLGIWMFFFLRKLNIVVWVWEISFLDPCHFSDTPLYPEMHPPRFLRKINYIKSFECQNSLSPPPPFLVNIRAMPQTGEIKVVSCNNETRAEDLVLIFFLSTFFFFFSFFFLRHETNKQKNKRNNEDEKATSERSFSLHSL